MVFSMCCNSTAISCSYTIWREIKAEIVRKTIQYLESKISEIQKELESKDCYENIKINGYPASNYESYINILHKELITPICNTSTLNEKDNILMISIGYDVFLVKDAMTCFGIYGMYLLCKECECSGSYSVGESYDILELLRLIKPLFDTTTDIYKIIYNKNNGWFSSIYDIFYDSATSFYPVRINYIMG